MSQPENNIAFDFSSITHTIQNTVVSLVNMQRENMPFEADYVQFILPNTLPPTPVKRNFVQQQLLGKPDISLIELEQAFERIGNSSRISGVVLHIRGFSMSFADLQSLRQIIQRLRKRGKKVIAYAQDYGMAEYFVASACDDVLLQPTGTLYTIGLSQSQTFVKDSLAAIGVEADVVNTTPYKGAGDSLARSEPSEEGAAQRNWLLDSIYETIIAGIAEGRNISEDAVREMIDQSPLTDAQALEGNYIDALINEEGLESYLSAKKIMLWEEANGKIPLKMPRPTDAYVAVLYVTGLIIPGESETPPTNVPIPIAGGPRMGDLTVTRQVRNLMTDDKCKALVLYVDSGGGSATASEAMASALDEFAKEKPIVVYMGSVAASGGYYIATPADYIVAQAATITGSIGVINLKLVVREFVDKLKLNPFIFSRGENANIFGQLEKFSDDEREKMVNSISRIYEVFVNRVAQSRKMKFDSVDEIGGGRVWTGKQALENGLVDELGGLHDAIAKARELANLPADAPFGLVQGKGKPLAAQVAEAADPAATLGYVYDNLSKINNANMMLMPFNINHK